MNQALRIFYNEQPWLDVRCNDAILLERANPVSVINIRSAASQLKDQLVIAAPFHEAWSEFTTANPDFDVQANRDVMFGLLHGDDPSLEAFEDILQSSRSMLTVTARAQQRESDVQERERLIAAIGSYNKDLSVIPLEDLRDIFATKAENQRRRHLSVEELRKLARTETPAHQAAPLPAEYTKEILLTMASDRLAKLVNRYGDAVNDRLGYIKPRQPGVQLTDYIQQLPPARRNKLTALLEKK
jgi:hypothetical protein